MNMEGTGRDPKEVLLWDLPERTEENHEKLQ
jgi:hypothetical protein